MIPVEYRRALALSEGDDVILRLDRDEVRVLSPRAAIRQAQEIVARSVPSDRSLADEFIAERRRDASVGVTIQVIR